MHSIQKGFKSLVHKMRIEEQKKLLPMKRTISLSTVAFAKEGGQLRKGAGVGRKAMGMTVGER